ncbi:MULTISPECIES: hypothetical protein [Limnospira]|nr:hypothetical protein [Arthrospira platensis]
MTKSSPHPVTSDNVTGFDDGFQQWEIDTINGRIICRWDYLY